MTAPGVASEAVLRTSREAAAASREPSGTTGETTGTASSKATAEATALAAHHVEEDLGVDASHAATHAAAAAAAKHVGGINEVIAVVVPSPLPAQFVSR